MFLRRWIIAGLLIAVTFPTAGRAGDAGKEPPFVVGVGARSLGMGGAFTSVADDAATLYYNPAGLARLDYQEVTAMHMSLLEGTIYDYAAWVYPTVSLGGFGIGAMRLGTDDIIKRENFVEVGEFGYSYSQLMLSYGRNFGSTISAGGSLKLLYQSLDIYNDWGIGMDLGVTVLPHEQVSIGVILRDMVPATLELNRTNETLPVTIAGGVAVRDLRISNNIKALIAFELEKTEDRDVRVHTGTEVMFDNTYALRAGYDRDNLSFGAGFRYDRLQLDYAYKIMDYVDDSHRMSISYRLGTSIPDQARREELEEERRGSQLLAEERERQFTLYKEKADDFYRQYRLDSALTYYQRALAFDENNQQIIGTIAAIENSRRIQRDQEQTLRDRQNELNLMIETYLEQARSFYDKEYYPAALDMLELIFEIDPVHASARRLEQQIQSDMSEAIAANLASASRAAEQGDAVRAIEAYERVLYLDPDNARATAGKANLGKTLDIARHLNTGIDLFKAGRYLEARKQFELVVSVNPDEPVAQEYLQRIEDALAHPPTLEEIQQDPPIWQLYLEGLRYMRNQEYRQAINAWEKVLEAYPGNEATLNNIEQARLRLSSGDQE